MCECYQVGGPFISEDPDCPIHGAGSQLSDQIQTIIEQAVLREISALEATEQIEELLK